MVSEFNAPDLWADVAVIVVTYNSQDHILGLLTSLRNTSRDLQLRVIVVDNNSTDATVSMMRSQNDVLLIEAGANLGYAAGINLGMRHAGECAFVLILNPDLTLMIHAVDRLVSVFQDKRVGAAVPLICNNDGSIYASLRREPSVLRSLCDSLFTGRLTSRIGLPSEFEHRERSYHQRHSVDWATGAVLLMPLAVARRVGRWCEDFFLYSEEVDFCRRIRDAGFEIHFEPSSIVIHQGGGSGNSPELSALMATNRIRYFQMYHGHLSSALFSMSVLFGHILRSGNRTHRHIVRVLLKRDRIERSSS